MRSNYTKTMLKPEQLLLGAQEQRRQQAVFDEAKKAALAKAELEADERHRRRFHPLEEILFSYNFGGETTLAQIMIGLRDRLFPASRIVTCQHYEDPCGKEPRHNNTYYLSLMAFDYQKGGEIASALVIAAFAQEQTGRYWLVGQPKEPRYSIGVGHLKLTWGLRNLAQLAKQTPQDFTCLTPKKDQRFVVAGANHADDVVKNGRDKVSLPLWEIMEGVEKLIPLGKTDPAPALNRRFQVVLAPLVDARRISPNGAYTPDPSLQSVWIG